MPYTIAGRILRSIGPILAAALVAPLPQIAQAQDRPAQARDRYAPAGVLREEIARRADGEVRAFYATRGNAPLWLNEFGRPSGAAAVLLRELRTADPDRVGAKKLKPDKLAKLVDRARRGDEDAVARADVELSKAFAAYVRAMRAAPRDKMAYESTALAPAVPTTVAALQAAARADSLEHYVAAMGWMHPLYAPLREALADPRYSEPQRRLLAANLDRVRAIPAVPQGRHILVDTASARLWMYEGDRVVDTMKVVVGKPDLQTPQLAGFIRTAILNPYWNIPNDLVQHNIAPHVVERGVGYLKSGGYQVLADWRPDAPLIDPRTVDWKAVRDGRAQVHVRQLPGGTNFMGKVKFEFPNPYGIYLHDTPDKHLLKEDARQLSSGCVRLEDAARMHRWLMGAPLPAKVKGIEQVEQLPEMVPVYITYLTALPDGAQIAFHPDPYGKDGMQLAAVDDDAGRADRP